MQSVPPLFRRFLLFVAVAGLLASSRAAHAQAPVGTWEAHTSMREVTAMARSDSALWVATAGGIFRYVPATGQLRRYTVVDGLHDINVQAITYDAIRRSVWVGYGDGTIDQLDLETQSVNTFQDIQRARRFPQRSIHHLRIRGDTLYAGTAFGVVVFDPERGEVRDSYTQLGTLTPATGVRDVAFAPTPEGQPGLWLATDGGVAYASRQASNLKDPTAWTAEPMAAANTQLVVAALAEHEDQIYAGIAPNPESGESYNGDREGLYRRGGAGYEKMNGINQAVFDLYPAHGQLYGVDRWRPFRLDEAGTLRRFGAEDLQQPVRLFVGDAEQLWVGDAASGLIVAAPLPEEGNQLSVREVVSPNGPYENHITSLHVGKQGQLIAGGSQERNAGFYVLHPNGTWTNYTGVDHEALQQNGQGFDRFATDSEGRIWAGSYGGGIAEVTPEDSVWRFSSVNSPLPSATDNDYVVVEGIALDDQNRLWATTQLAPNNALHMRTPDGTWQSLPNVLSPDLGKTYDYLFIDSHGQKWIATAQSQKLRINDGLLVLNTQGTPVDPGDDTYNFFGRRGSNGTGLPSTFVNDIVEDRDGAIWVATDEGPARLLNAGFAASTQNVQFTWPQRADFEQGENPYLLNGLNVNDFAVDPANRIWAATGEGLYQIEQAERGYRVRHHFTATGTPLPSSSVRSVAVNDQTGVVYFATDNGLFGYQGTAVQPQEQVQDLVVYPNPVVLGEGESRDIFIEGLVEQTSVRIVTPDGKVVAQIAGRGGRARWDGRDQNGQPVPSGVYIVVAVGQSGEGTAYGKVAVLR